MKTNLLKNNISIRFEGEPCRCTPRNLHIGVDNFVLLVLLDGSTYFLRQNFQPVLFTVDDTLRALPYRTLFSFFFLKKIASFSPVVDSFVGVAS